MKNLLFFIAILPITLFAQQEYEGFNFSKELDKAYFAGTKFDTIVFVVDKPYKYNYIGIEGTDINQDQDQDYTDFLLIINGQPLLDTVEFYRLNGIGKDGKIGFAVININDLVKVGKNYIILGNTEQPGQQDYAVVKDITYLGTDRDFSFENEIEDKAKAEGYDRSLIKVYQLSKGQTITLKKTFYPDNDYRIIIASQEPDVKFAAKLLNGEKAVVKGTSKNQMIQFDFKQKQQQDKTLKIQLTSAPDDKEHLITVWVFYK